MPFNQLKYLIFFVLCAFQILSNYFRKKSSVVTFHQDYCSFLKITDPSNVKVSCTVFQEELHNHPQVFRTGDIVRLHRVKAQAFRGSIIVTTTHCFSTVVFDGTVGSPVVPRTSSRKLHFTAEDEQTVERLRRWALEQTALLGAATVRLANVEPRMYFDFTCQLLAKAEMDRNCTLLKVWDGTECPHPLLDVSVEPEAQQGSMAVPECRRNLVASVLVYDDHVKMTQDLKPGTYLRIYNLHAVLQTTSAASPSGKSDQLCLHLHGGTSYGRGLRILPKDSPDLQDLTESSMNLNLPSVNLPSVTVASFLNCFATRRSPLSVSLTLFFSSSCQETSCGAERTCEHALEQVLLSSVRKSTPPRMFHVRAQLKTFQPQRLYQCLKLHCPQCRAIGTERPACAAVPPRQDIPDEEAIADVLRRAVGTTAFSSEPWLLTGFLESTEPGRDMAVHLPSSSHNDQTSFIFLEGKLTALEEVCQISESRAVVPVRSHDGKMAFLDFSVPVVFRGSARHYGECALTPGAPIFLSLPVPSHPLHLSPPALGVQLLQYVLLMKLELEDGTDSLQALLWQDAVSESGRSGCRTHGARSVTRCIRSCPCHTEVLDRHTGPAQSRAPRQLALLTVFWLPSYGGKALLWSSVRLSLHFDCSLLLQETFFGVSAHNAATDQQLQDRIQGTMDRLCPPEGTMGNIHCHGYNHPWSLGLCKQ
uniref:Protection of telomeres protein 1 n=1 Tax=Paramormyrops kingsleyae TaxID=1676925 RepID=A0A3B3SKH0_9TELE